MFRFARLAAVLAVTLGAFIATQAALAAPNCGGKATSGLAAGAGLTPSAVGKHGGANAGHVNKLIREVCAETDSPPTAAAAAMQDAGYEPAEIGDVLVSGFDQTVLESAEIFAYLGFDATEIAEMLLETYAQTPLEGAQILKALGFDAVEVGTALRDVFSQTALQSAGILKQVVFDAVEVGTALRDVFAQTAAGAAGILKQVAFTAVQVGTR